MKTNGHQVLPPSRTLRRRLWFKMVPRRGLRRQQLKRLRTLDSSLLSPKRLSAPSLSRKGSSQCTRDQLFVFRRGLNLTNALCLDWLMISDDAFLRRLPTVLDARQAIQLEALLFSADTIEASYRAIVRVTTQHRERIVQAGRRARIELFTHAWTIVDCLHVARQALASIDYQTPQASAFATKYSCARSLRNKMDHLTKNAGNVANAKRRPPVFGALSYVCIREEDFVSQGDRITMTGGGIVVLTAGRILGGQHAGMVNPAGREWTGPVGLFRLEAFDEILELEDADRDMRTLLVEVNVNLEKQVTALVEKLSSEHNVPIEQLMAHPAEGLSVFLAFKI
jgi:hypothetical protein